MGQLLTVSRAAHLIGVSRGDMQKKILDGELPSFDGMVDSADLLQVWPGLELELTGAFEKVAAIRESAFARRMRERILPSQEALARRLYAQGQELAELRRVLTRYHDLVEALRERLDLPPPPDRAELARLLDDGLAAVLGEEAGTDALAVMDDMLRVMSAQVTVRPSGREFFVDGAETLLNAALRAGLAPNYGCGNGSCGLCKARVVSGEARAVAASDHVFTGAEKAQGYVLMCSCTALSSELTLELLEGGAPEDIPEQRLVTRVRALSPLGDDLLRLHLQTPRSSRLRFLAGQRVTLGLADGAGAHGEYPIASCPCDDRNLLFHIPRRRGDDFAARLFAGAVNSGDEVSVWGPWGDFVLDKASMRPLIFVAIDHGFAPVNSLIEHALAVDAAESLALYWASSSPAGPYLANQARAWATALDDFRYLPLAVPELKHVLAADPALADSDVYLSGPEAAVAEVAAAILAAGLPVARLHSSAC